MKTTVNSRTPIPTTAQPKPMKNISGQIHSDADLQTHKQVLKAYIHNEEQKVISKIPAIENPVVAKLGGVVAAFLLKKLLSRIFR